MCFNRLLNYMSAMKKFEYKSYTFAYMENDSIEESDIKELNKLGTQGLGGSSCYSCKIMETSRSPREFSGYFEARSRK